MARIKWLLILLLVVSVRVHGQDSEDYQAHGDKMLETKKYYQATVSYLSYLALRHLVKQPLSTLRLARRK